MNNKISNEQAMYERCITLPKLDIEKIRPLIKNNTDVSAFLKKQYSLQSDEDTDGMWIENADLCEFLGQDFLTLTEQPQHCALTEDERFKERLCEYYPDIFWAMYFHNAKEDPNNNPDVVKRKGYIYGHTRRTAQFLQAIALSDLKDENEFWSNYAWNVEHYRYKYYYQTAHTKREVPNYPTCFVTRVDRYATWLRSIVDEFVDADFNYNEDLTKGGMTRLYKDNRVWLTSI